jgi:hypothetical protein
MKRVLTAGRITTKGRDRELIQYALAADDKSVLGVARYQPREGHPIHLTALGNAASTLEIYRDAGFPGTIDK